MLLFGMLHSGKLELNKGLIIGLGIAVGLVVIVAVLIITGAFTIITDYISSGNSSLISNAIFIIVIAGAIAVALATGGKSSGAKEK
jgi:hypothetical protein